MSESGVGGAPVRDRWTVIERCAPRECEAERSEGSA